MNLNFLRCAIVACALALAACAPLPWACTGSQGGAHNVWINEVHYAATLISDRAVEIMALNSAGIDSLGARTSLVVVDGLGTVVGTRTLAGCLLHTELALPWNASAWVCTDLGDLKLEQLIATGGGGLALVQAPPTPGSAPIVTQYIAVGTAAPYRGVTPCMLPLPVQEGAVGEPGTSVQLVSLPTGASPSPEGAQWMFAPHDPVSGWVSVTTSWGWEAGLPITFGVENAGMVGRGGGREFVQTFREAGPDEAALVAAVDYASPSAPPPANGSVPLDCALGPVGQWSSCSQACVPVTASPGEAPPTGVQIQWQPIVSLPTAGGLACPPLTNRSTQRMCTFPAPCTTCSNLRVDGAERDVDCGGGMADSDFTALLPPGKAVSVHDVVRILFLDPSSPVAAVQTLPPSACARCDMGRKCALHNDCSRAQGLVCAPGLDVCSPWQVLNATAFVRIPLEMAGADPSSALSGSALSALRRVFAGLASGNGNAVHIDNVTLAGMTYRPAGAAAGRRMGRALAADTDSIAAVVLVSAPDAVQAGIMAAAVNARTVAGAAVIEEALRPTSPLVRDTLVGTASVVSNPYGTGEGAIPPDGEGGRRSARDDPSNATGSGSGDTGLSGGAITGIVLGALVILGIASASVVAVVTKRNAAAEERARAETAAAARRTGHGINVGETGGQQAAAGAADLVPVTDDRGKTGFAPKHANRESDSRGVLATAGRGGKATPLPGAGATAGRLPVGVVQGLKPEGGVGGSQGSPQDPASSPSLNPPDNP